MRDRLGDFALESNFEWIISPANSPWRQGRAESRIKSLKRLLSISVGSTKLTPTELQTVLYEVADISNERPIGVTKTPSADGSFKILTPNCLIMGRASNSAPDDANLSAHMSKSDRYHLIQQVTAEFWSRWAKESTPEHVIRQKWHETGRDLKVNDVVLIHDQSAFKGKYPMGLVETVNVGRDGRVRSCTVSYTIPRSRDLSGQYTGGKRVLVTRSVQRLSLLLAVEEQCGSMEVVGFRVMKKNQNNVEN